MKSISSGIDSPIFVSCVSFAKDIVASYTVSSGKTTVAISSKSDLKYRSINVGTGKMSFRLVETGRGEAWHCDVSMDKPMPAQVNTVAMGGGSQRMEVMLGDVFPAGVLLDEVLQGAVIAPAIHVDIPWGHDIWVYLIRSPWSPIRFQVDRSALTLMHDASRVVATLSVSLDGTLVGQITSTGSGIKQAMLVLTRSLGSYSNDVFLGEVENGTQAVEWKPIMREFDTLLVTQGEMSHKDLLQFAGSLGADINPPRLLFLGGLREAFVLCDGPTTSYTLVLSAHEGLMKNAQDQTRAEFK